MFRAWDDAVRVLTGRPTGTKVTGEVFDMLESDGDERPTTHLYGANRSFGSSSFSSGGREDQPKEIRYSKRNLQ